jgi:hypothetical protein
MPVEGEESAPTKPTRSNASTDTTTTTTTTTAKTTSTTTPKKVEQASDAAAVGDLLSPRPRSPDVDATPAVEQVEKADDPVVVVEDVDNDDDDADDAVVVNDEAADAAPSSGTVDVDAEMAALNNVAPQPAQPVADDQRALSPLDNLPDLPEPPTVSISVACLFDQA